MVSIEYKNAYREVLEILKYISKEEFNKIPKEVIRSFEENANNNYNFPYTPNKTLDEQSVSKTAKYIIAILFRDYWATQKQREKILEKEKYDLIKLEKQKREKYNPDEIFNKNLIISNKDEQLMKDNMENIKIKNIEHKINDAENKSYDSSINKSLVKYEENTIWNKIKRFLKEIINRS